MVMGFRLRSGIGRVIVKLFSGDPLAAPAAQGYVIHHRGLAIFGLELEIPVDHDEDAIDQQAPYRPGDFGARVRPRILSREAAIVSWRGQAQ
jgi:hypothetical protein